MPWAAHWHYSILTRCSISFFCFCFLLKPTRSCDGSNQNAVQSSVSADLAQKSIFLTTLRAQEWAQYGLNSCGLLQGWIEIALLYSSLTDSLDRECCFLFIQMQKEKEHKSSLHVGGLSQFCGGHLHDCRGSSIVHLIRCLTFITF